MTHSQSDHPLGLWNLDRIRSIEGSLEPPIEGSRVQALFDEAGSVAGIAGCNSYRGRCQIEEGAFSVGPLATTRKYCLRPTGVMEQESRYLELLARATRYSFDANTLRFLDDSDTLLLVMARAGDRQGEAEI